MSEHEIDRVLAQRIEQVQARMAAAARRAGRDPDAITLVAVSKTQSPETVAAAYRAGLRLFGENRVEEAGPKAVAVARLLAPAPPPAWHMIGHLQSRKAADVLPWASMIHSVDSVKLAARLSRAIQAASGGGVQAGLEALAGLSGQRSQPAKASIPDVVQETRIGIEAPADLSGQWRQPANPERSWRSASIPILLEVNVAGEESKYGFAAADLPAAVEAIATLPGLRIAGLMTMAPIVPDPELARPVFVGLRRLRDDLARRYPALDWQHLSMGMTDDFEVAIEEGATLVRIGRAIFGE